MKAGIVNDIRAELGEGAIWDSEKKILYWLDILSKKIYVYEPSLGKTREYGFESMPTAVVPRDGTGLAMVFEDGFYFVYPEGDRREKIIDPEEAIEANRFNDGKCDPAGRLWAGTMSRSAAVGMGSLYCLEADLSCSVKLREINISNGICWSPDELQMYYTDTLSREIWAFDYNAATGEILNRRTAVSVPEEEGYPDGMTIDSEGNLWAALWEGGKVACYEPKTGRKLDEIRLPASLVTSCAFGGVYLDELYITTARTGLSEQELLQQEAAGALFMARPGVRGLPAFSFAG
jgi:sugar lactone lactonase YvrE